MLQKAGTKKIKATYLVSRAREGMMVLLFQLARALEVASLVKTSRVPHRKSHRGSQKGPPERQPHLIRVAWTARQLPQAVPEAFGAKNLSLGVGLSGRLLSLCHLQQRARVSEHLGAVNTYRLLQRRSLGRSQRPKR